MGPLTPLLSLKAMLLILPSSASWPPAQGTASRIQMILAGVGGNT